MMKKLFFALCLMLCVGTAGAFTVMNSRELGKGDARNQNVTVRCTTPDGRVSSETCQLRRYVRCNEDRCGGWQQWFGLRNPDDKFDSWRDAASACCNAMGLR
ncbi:hypothetical protein FACS189421_06960 [Bacteroidia bacterium]|nr:hypothetical protein FACS189421_06960 [Bacteroidia bacterium]